MDAMDVVKTFEREGSLKQTVKALGVSKHKILKILVAAGAFESPRQKQVAALVAQGKSMEEIMAELKISRSTACMYMPYTRGMRDNEHLTANAKRIRKCRAKKLSEQSAPAESECVEK